MLEVDGGNKSDSVLWRKLKPSNDGEHDKREDGRRSLHRDLRRQLFP